jgi:hypothetical protein
VNPRFKAKNQGQRPPASPSQQAQQQQLRLQVRQGTLLTDFTYHRNVTPSSNPLKAKFSMVASDAIS